MGVGEGGIWGVFVCLCVWGGGSWGVCGGGGCRCVCGVVVVVFSSLHVLRCAV